MEISLIELCLLSLLSVAILVLTLRAFLYPYSRHGQAQEERRRLICVALGIAVLAIQLLLLKSMHATPSAVFGAACVEALIVGVAASLAVSKDARRNQFLCDASGR